MMLDREPLFCLRCGEATLSRQGNKALHCSACDFLYFHNVATAVGALLVLDGKVLLQRRARQPGQGMLGLPGGFVDPFEHAEQALQREIKEELGFVVEQAGRYIGAWANQYPYAGVTYHTQDIYFMYTLSELPDITLQTEEVSEVIWLSAQELDTQPLAFSSARFALNAWRDLNHP